MTSCYVDLYKYWSPERDEFSDRPEVWLLDDYLPFLADCHRLVDLGCGVGNLVKRWQDEGKEAQGVTYQKAEVIAAKQKHGIDVAWGDLHSLPFDDNQFDGMVMWDVLEHTLAPLIALCEARRVVRPDGRGLIFIPGHPWWHTPYHIICPTKQQMIHLLELSGWKLHRMVDLSHVPGHRVQEEMAVYEVVA